LCRGQRWRRASRICVTLVWADALLDDRHAGMLRHACLRSLLAARKRLLARCILSWAICACGWRLNIKASTAARGCGLAVREHSGDLSRLLCHHISYAVFCAPSSTLRMADGRWTLDDRAVAPYGSGIWRKRWLWLSLTVYVTDVFHRLLPILLSGRRTTARALFLVRNARIANFSLSSSLYGGRRRGLYSPYYSTDYWRAGLFYSLMPAYVCRQPLRREQPSGRCRVTTSWRIPGRFAAGERRRRRSDYNVIMSRSICVAQYIGNKHKQRIFSVAVLSSITAHAL